MARSIFEAILNVLAEAGACESKLRSTRDATISGKSGAMNSKHSFPELFTNI